MELPGNINRSDSLPSLNDTGGVPVVPKPSIAYASFNERVVAHLIDGAILIGASSLLGYLSLGVSALIVNVMSADSFNGFYYYLLDITGYGLSLLFSYLYLGVYQHKTGQTIGKQKMKIKVVTLDFQTPSVGKFLLRETVFKFISFTSVDGILRVNKDEKKQALHDKWAHTVVIKV